MISTRSTLFVVLLLTALFGYTQIHAQQTSTPVAGGTNIDGIDITKSSTKNDAIALARLSSISLATEDVRASGAELGVSFTPNPALLTDDTCSGNSPSWRYLITLTNIGEGSVTIDGFEWHFYDDKGVFSNTQTNTSQDFVSYFDDCGGGSADIPASGTACAMLCAHLGGSDLGGHVKMVFNGHTSDGVQVSVSGDEYLDAYSAKSWLASTKFVHGQSVYVKNSPKISVRETPGGTVIGSQLADAFGQVVSGPEWAYPHWRWEVRFEDGLHGWVQEAFIEPTDEPEPSIFTCGTSKVQDADSNIYNTVLIGTQCWMKQNMRVGTMVQGANEQTDNGVIDKWCYDNDLANCTSNNPNYPDGGLYQWNEAMQYVTTPGAQGICPSGWHIPTHDELTTLERAVCTSGTCATDFPYDTTTTGWRGTNEGTKLQPSGSSGFEFNLAGYGISGSFDNRGAYGHLWSSSESGGSAWGRYVLSGGGWVVRYPFLKTDGISVRCIKDSDTDPEPTNTPPTLEYPEGDYNDGVHPNTGGLDTVFTFQVVYTDGNNDKPEDVTLHYRGENWVVWSSSTMNRATGGTGEWYDGEHDNGELYEFKGKFDQVKKYEYYFTTDDGTNSGTAGQDRLPEGEDVRTFDVVESAQYIPPRLEFLTDGLNAGDGLYPNEGKVNATNFQFKVKYSGIDLNKAQDVTVHIRRPSSGTYDAGGEFIPEIQVARNLLPDTTPGVYTVNLAADSEGEYQYYFTASDRRGGEVRLPSGNQVLTFSAYDDYYKLKVEGEKYYVRFSNAEDALRPVPLKGERVFFDEEWTRVTDGTVANQLAYAGFVYETLTQPTYQSNIATSVTTLEVLTEQLGIIASLEVLNECKLNVAVAIVIPPTTLAAMTNCALGIIKNTQSYARIDTFLKVADLADDARSLNSRMGKLSDPSYILDYSDALEARSIMDRFYLIQPLVVPLVTYIYELDKSLLNSAGDSALSTLKEVPSLLPTGIFDDIISKYPNIENVQALHRVVRMLEFVGDAEGYVWYARYLDEALDDNELQSFYYRQINLESINTKLNQIGHQTGNCASINIPATCLSFISGQAHSPGDLRITDKFGRITGQVDGEVYTQIPGSIFLDERFLLTDLDNTYAYAFIGNTDGFYGLSVSYLQDSRLEVFDVRNVPTTLNQNHSYFVKWTKSDQNSPEVELKVDQEGDGIIEHTFQVSNGLTDVISPTTTPTLTGTLLTPDTYLGTTTLTLTAEDNEGGVGVEKTEYSFDGETWHEYNAPVEVTDEGTHTISYRSTDWFGNVEETKSVTFTIIMDDTSPVTTLSAEGAGNDPWFRSDITVTLTATDDKTGVASTTYSLDNGTTWLDYSVPFTVTGEGEHTVLYRSSDKAGNTEDTKTATLYIDLTAPEVRISANILSKDLLVTGNDNMGSTTVAENTTGYTISDEAGHTTKLLVTKKWAGKALTMAQVTGIQYDSAPVVALPKTQLLYVWTPWKGVTNLTNQTVHVNKTFTVNATYLKPLNRTTVTVAKDGKVGKPQTFPGLKLVTLTTAAGVIGYEL